jgi:hypothetical protein
VVASRREHGERVLCDTCADRPPISHRLNRSDPLMRDAEPKPKRTRRSKMNGKAYAAASEDPAAELTSLLALDTVGLSVVFAELFGRGSNATAHIHVSAGGRVVLDPLGKFASPSKLSVELALQVGAAPTLKGPQVVRVMALLHTLSDHHDTLDADNRATDWGISYLQAAQVITVQLSDQAGRWAAFELLSKTDPCRPREQTARRSRQAASSSKTRTTARATSVRSGSPRTSGSKAAPAPPTRQPRPCAASAGRSPDERAASRRPRPDATQRCSGRSSGCPQDGRTGDEPPLPDPPICSVL